MGTLNSVANVLSALSWWSRSRWFHAIEGIYTVVPLWKVLYTNFASSMVASWFKLKSDLHNKAGKGKAEISKTISRQCMLPYVYHLTLCYESGAVSKIEFSYSWPIFGCCSYVTNTLRSYVTQHHKIFLWKDFRRPLKISAFYIMQPFTSYQQKIDFYDHKSPPLKVPRLNSLA